MDLTLKNVLLLDSVDRICSERLVHGGIQVTTKGKLNKEELIVELQNHDAVVVRSATKITSEIIEQSHQRLKVIGRAGTGVDNIDVDAANRHGILVMNAPGGNTNSAVEHTCALILALSRTVPQACESMRAGNWDRKRFMGSELQGKVLAIIGLGRIGREVCTRMSSFGMKIIGYDPIVDKSVAHSWGIQSLPLEEIWPLADYITVHTPLIPQTRYLINEEVFSKCKESVKIINVARGGIVKEVALLEALDSGKCGGAALDVFEEEPPKNMDLIQHPKVICTPHLGANTVEAQRRVAVEMADQLLNMSEGKELSGLINGTCLVQAAMPKSKPWVNLASTLGCLASKFVAPSPGTQISIELHGEDVNHAKKSMVAAVLKGFLETLRPNVNLVNAATLAEDFQISSHLKTNPKNINKDLYLINSVVILVENGVGTYSLTGSCSAIGSPLLFSINDCHFPSGLSLEKNLLFFGSSPKILEAFGLVASALKHLSLQALLSSASGKETWVVARTENDVQNIPIIQQVQLIAQIRF